MAGMIELSEHAEGILLPVRAQPGASKNEFRGEQNGMLKVCVTQVAEKGKANFALEATIATELRLKMSQVQLLSGDTQAQKRFLIRGITRDELQQRLADALSD